MSSAAAAVRHAPPALWDIALGFLHVLYNLFGAPEEVAAQHTLNIKGHALLLSWLRAGEALVRRLLLIEASAYPAPNVRPLLRKAKARAPQWRAFSAEKPQEWRVSFRCLMSPSRRARPAKRTRSEAPPPYWLHETLPPHLAKRARRMDRAAFYARQRVRFRSAWPLAERYEALLRVCENPAPYARRLARRLHAEPHRVGEVMRFPEDSLHKIGADAARTVDAAAWEAMEQHRWDTS